MNQNIKNMRIWIYVLLGGVLALCLWTVFAVGVALIPLIPLDIPPKIASNLNQIALNLSYSFIAAFVFFILTAVVPYLWTKKSLGSAIQIKRLNINRIIRDLLFHFAKGTEYSATD